MKKKHTLTTLTLVNVLMLTQKLLVLGVGNDEYVIASEVIGISVSAADCWS